MRARMLKALVIGAGLLLTATTGWTQTLTWTYPTGTAITGFHVYRAPTTGTPAVCGTMAMIGSTAGTVLTYKDIDPTLVLGAVYCYSVKAYNAAIESDPSNVVQFTEALPPPTLVTITASVTMTGPGAGGELRSNPAGINTVVTGTYQAPFASNATVVLTATPKPNGSRIARWTGDCVTAGTAQTCTVVMTRDLLVAVEFVK